MFAVFEENRFVGLVNSNQHVPPNTIAIPLPRDVYADLIGNVRKQRKLRLSYDASGNRTLLLPDAKVATMVSTECCLVVDTTSQRDYLLSLDSGAGVVVQSDDPRCIVVNLNSNPIVVSRDVAENLVRCLDTGVYTLLNVCTLQPLHIREVLHTTNKLPSCIAISHANDVVSHAPFAGVVVYDSDYPLFGCAWVTTKDRVPSSALHALTSREVQILLNGVTPVEYTTKLVSSTISGAELVVHVDGDTTKHRTLDGVIVYDSDYPLLGIQWISQQNLLSLANYKLMCGGNATFLEDGLLPITVKLKQ